MSKSLKQILVVVTVLVLLYAGASVLVTITQLSTAADRVHLGAGRYVFWSLLSLFTVLVCTPVILYLRLPKPPIPPTEQDKTACDQHLQYLLQSLRRNPKLDPSTLQGTGDVSAALQTLGALSDETALKAASATFVSTALMQNGRLDGLLVLASQLRLVWRIMSIYHLRPAPRQVLYVYANVGGSMLAATSLDEVDFAAVTSPLLSAIAPSLTASVPGLGGLSKLLGNSLASGAANAFLTLRVAMLTKHYCQALVHPQPDSVRRSASLEAVALLAIVSRDSGSHVVKAVVKGAGEMLAGAASATAQGIATAMANGANVAGEQVRSAGKSVGRAVSATAQGAVQLGGKMARLGRQSAEADPNLPTSPERDLT